MQGLSSLLIFLFLFMNTDLASAKSLSKITSQLENCKISPKVIDGSVLQVNADKYCPLGVLAEFLVNNECRLERGIEGIMLQSLSEPGSPYYIALNKKTCNEEYNLNDKKEAIKNMYKVLVKNNKKKYVVQFYSGRNAPNSRLRACIGAPTEIRRRNLMYVLVSKPMAYSKAVKLRLKSLSDCKDTDFWIDLAVN
ncbi:hypothetical protein [Vibrio coralliirubri]|uniref:hypothetical protein n=1 Tax=Vibrio coralliirubri TaxID=1516159 RepID=UPI0012F73C0E|nr:hypothetical protein [Vibrio coralliirubri]